MLSKHKLIRTLGHARRRTFETFGSYRFSRTGAEDIDRKLERHLDIDGGFFVEAGANDGVNFSNTYYLERARGWSGVLVEGIPQLYDACVRHRPRSHVVNCALVAPEHAGRSVRMHYSNLQSIVSGALPYEHVEAGLASQDEATYDVEVPGRTLSSVLEEVAPARIDLLVLDVEGYEPQALRGLDLDRHAPRFALIEILDEQRREAVEAVIGERYVEVDRFTPTDVLYEARP
ncbi:MAG TPA: FkbM family methyltransferase [Candidatus Limnocylindria bacterium]|nr:FkbM family methyltransferase [Candidatus Limnocylindria bacterium]